MIEMSIVRFALKKKKKKCLFNYSDEDIYQKVFHLLRTSPATAKFSPGGFHRKNERPL